MRWVTCLMPTYCYKCSGCYHTTELHVREAPWCSRCKKPMVRDYRAEGVANNFRPTANPDPYGKDVARRAAKERKEQG